MPDAKAGDTVRIHYTGTLSDGSVFDSSKERDPLEFTLGSGQVIRGFDAAVDGMSAGQSKTVEIAAEDAYGQSNPDAVQAFPRSKIPDDVPLAIGTRLQLQTAEGHPVMVTVSKVTDDEVFLDGNHPLAGKALTFEIELVEIVSA